MLSSDWLPREHSHQLFPPFYIVPNKYLVGSCASCCWNVAAVTVTQQTKEKVKHFFQKKTKKKQEQVYTLQAAAYDSESPFGVLLRGNR